MLAGVGREAPGIGGSGAEEKGGGDGRKERE